MGVWKRLEIWWLGFRLRAQVFLKRLGIDISSLGYAQRWVILGSLIGVVGSLGAIVFTSLIQLFELATRPLMNCCIVAAPTVGGLVSGILVYTFAPEAEGHGTDAAIDAIHRRWARIRARIPVIKTLASASTIASGGSAGKEGPIAQIAAGIGSVLGERLRLSIRDRRNLVIAGIAAGIGAIFKAPLGAAIFSVEVLYKRDYEVDALMPAIIASIVAYSIYGAFTGWTPVLTHPGYAFNPLELGFMVIVGVVMGVLAVIYVTIFYGARDYIFKRIRLPDHVKPAIGGFLVGLIGLKYSQVLGGGYDVMNGILSGRITAVHLLIVLAIFKIIATSFTISSGGSGGVFAPSLFIGASFGAAMGYIFHQIAPEIVSMPTAYALIGMAAFFSAAAKAPLTSIIMVAEMSGGYTLLVPITMSSVISYVVSGARSIYEKQMLHRQAGY